MQENFVSYNFFFFFLFRGGEGIDSSLSGFIEFGRMIIYTYMRMYV